MWRSPPKEWLPPVGTWASHDRGSWQIAMIEIRGDTVESLNHLIMNVVGFVEYHHKGVFNGIMEKVVDIVDRRVC